jgi:two pore calcium channel protein
MKLLFSFFQSYRQLTGSYWSLIYFVSFYLISVLLLLNLIVAFVLEAFFAEMELEKDGEADIQVRTIFVPTTNSLYLYLENC